MSKIKDQFKKINQIDLEKDNEIFKNKNFMDVIPSPFDERDFPASQMMNETFPKEYESKTLPILDQGTISSCVAHSCASSLMYAENKLVNSYNDYSRGYIYGNRAEDDHQAEGMYIRQALKQLNHCGDVLYEDFPYNAAYNVVKDLIKNNEEELSLKAGKHKIIEYFRCYTEQEIKRTIMNNGSVIISVPVYSDFGRNLHKTETNKYSGNHAMIIIGWTADNKWIVQNSWGKIWGYRGKLLMDMDYPVNEYWGIIVNNENIFGKKTSLIRKIYLFIKAIFGIIFKK